MVVAVPEYYFYGSMILAALGCIWLSGKLVKYIVYPAMEKLGVIKWN
jgi:hypothetical protein